MNIELLTPILPVAAPQSLRLRLEDVDPLVNSVTVTIIRVGELRDDWVFGTSVSLNRGAAIECDVPLNSFTVGLYQVAEIVPDYSDTRVMRVGLPATKRNDLYFLVGDEAGLSADPNQLALEIYTKRIQSRSAPLLTESAAESSGEQHRAVVFFIGVRLHHPQQLKGCLVKPVSLGMGLASLNEVVSKHLHESLGHVISFQQQADLDFRADNPLFAVHIENLLATDMSDALSYVLNYSIDIATLIGTERGEKPTRCAVYLANKIGFSLYPIMESYRGNIVAPMFRNEQADLLERYLPILSRSHRSRLDLELYIQALGERDRGFQYFRYWAMLEMITFRHVTSSRARLLHPDGSQILGRDGSPRTSRGNSERVYQYLYKVGVHPQQMMWKAPDGRDLTMQGTKALVASSTTEIMSLWTAVRAAYRIRNAVAHDGNFKPNIASSDSEEVIASHMYSVGPSALSFLALETKSAVFRELKSTSA